MTLLISILRFCFLHTLRGSYVNFFFVSFCCTGFVATTLQAQDNSYIGLSIEQGLPSSEVYEVIQDSKGFIWFATDNGVARYDGQTLKVFNSAQGMDDPVVFGMQEDHRGRIWLRTYSGRLFYIENEKLKSFKYNDKLAELCKMSIMASFYVSTKGEIWFTTSSILCHIDSLGNLFTQKTPNNSLLVKSIEANHEIIGSWSSQFDTLIIDDKLLPQEFKIYSTSSLKKTFYWQGKRHLAVDQCLYQLKDEKLIRVFSGPSTIISVNTDRKGDIYIGFANQGVYRFDNDAFQQPTSIPILRNKSVSGFLEDKEGGLWFTTLENGVYYIPNSAAHYFSLPLKSKIKSIAYNEREVFLGAYDGTLTHIDSETMTPVTEKKSDNSIHALFIGKNGKLWLSSHFLQVDNVLVKPTTLNTNFLDFVEDEQENVWGISNTGINKFNAFGGLIWYKYRQRGYRSLFVMDSLIYAIGRIGLEVLDTSLNEISKFTELNNVKIRRCLVINDTLVLAATIGSGLILINPKNHLIKSLQKNRSLTASNVYSIEKEGSSVWLGTEHGVGKIEVHDLLKGNYLFRWLTKRNGLKSDKVNHLAFSGEKLWVFSDEGLTTIPISKIRFASAKPTFYLKNVSVNNVPINIADQIRLSHTQNNIQINFGYVGFAANNIRSRFRLNESNLWTYIDNQTLELAELSPGRYSLLTEYSTDNIHWEKANAGLRIIILPPWWKLWYVQSFFILTIAVSIYLYIQRRIAIFKERENYLRIINEQQQNILQAEIEATERERIRIGKELHDGVSTDLTSLKLSTERVLRKFNLEEASQFENHLQHTIGELKNIIYGLAPPGLEHHGLRQGLTDYLNRINESSSVEIKFEYYGEEVKGEKLPVYIFRIIQELVANSVRHSKCTVIVIQVNAFDDFVNIAFSDNGTGFTDTAKEGLGLSNIRSRVKSLGGDLNFESGKFGTTYTFDIPFKK